MTTYFTHYIHTKFDKVTNEKTNKRIAFPKGKVSKEDGYDLIRAWNKSANSWNCYGFDYETKTIE